MGGISAVLSLWWHLAPRRIGWCRPGLPCGLSLALILAEPVLWAHPERRVLRGGVGVVGDVSVAAGGAEVAAGHGEPLGRAGFLLADDRPLGADVPVRQA